MGNLQSNDRNLLGDSSQLGDSQVVDVEEQQEEGGRRGEVPGEEKEREREYSEGRTRQLRPDASWSEISDDSVSVTAARRDSSFTTPVLDVEKLQEDVEDVQSRIPSMRHHDLHHIKELRLSIRTNTIVVLNKHFETEEEVLKTLVDVCVDSGKLSEDKRPEILNSRKVLFPHKEDHHLIYFARVSGITERMFVLMRLREAVFFDAHDGGLTYFAFLILEPLETTTRAKYKETQWCWRHLAKNTQYRYEARNAATDIQFQAVVDKFAATEFVDFYVKKNRERYREDGLYWSGKPFGGIIADVQRRIPHYMDDWKDGLTFKSISASLFMFFACLAPGVAFGAVTAYRTLQEDVVKTSEMGIIEFLLAQAWTSCVFAIIAGQPLVILRPTGPITVFIIAVYEVCEGAGWDFLAFNFWVGFWGGIIMMLVGVLDLCWLTRYVTHFTEQIFSLFVSMIFLYEGLHNLFHYYSDKEHFSTAVALWSTIIAIMVFFVAYHLDQLRTGIYFVPKVREYISDFALPIAIIIVTIINYFAKIEGVETLQVPNEFRPTQVIDVSDSGAYITRSWVVDVLNIDTWVIFVAIVPGLLLTCLVYLDQNVCTLLVSAPENHLKVGGGYHINMFVIGVFNMICPIFGMPFVMGSLPHSPQFVQALAVKEEYEIDGKKKEKVIHVHENRLAPLASNLLVGLCLIDVILRQLQKLPRSTFDGLFFFMGVAGLGTNPLWERFLVMFTEYRYYPSTHYYRMVQRVKLHTYTLMQILFVIILLVVATQDYISLAFPFFVIVLMPFRVHLSRITRGFFTKRDLSILDSAEYDTFDDADKVDMERQISVDVEKNDKTIRVSKKSASQEFFQKGDGMEATNGYEANGNYESEDEEPASMIHEDDIFKQKQN